MSIDVRPTASAIQDMANNLKHYAMELERIKASMIKYNDISYAGEALNSVTSCFSNMRMDLLVTRPIREYDRVIVNMNESQQKVKTVDVSAMLAEENGKSNRREKGAG